MRKLLIAGLLLSSATPALAAPESGRIVDALPHPYDVEAAGDTLRDAVDAISGVRIGNVVRAIDPAARIPADATIADVAGRDDPAFRDRLQDEVAGLSGKAADMVRGLTAAVPALERSLAELERSLAGVLGNLPR